MHEAAKPPSTPRHASAANKRGGKLPASRDAALIALCDAYAADARLADALFCALPGDDCPEADALDKANAARLPALIGMRATTAEGIAARVRVMAAENCTDSDINISPVTLAGRMVAALMRDALLMDGQKVPADLLECAPLPADQPAPDEEIAACAPQERAA